MTKGSLIRVSQARAGAIYEIGKNVLSINPKHSEWVFLCLIFIRFTDPILIFYELVAGTMDDPPLLSRRDNDPFYLRKIKQCELPLYIHLEFKTKIFDS